MSAMPMGAPGCPELACCTASMASARIAFAIREELAIEGELRGRIRGNPPFYGQPPRAWPKAEWLPPSSKVTPMQGLHLTADLYQCRCEAAWLTDATRLGEWCVKAVRAAGLQPVNQLFHAFPPTPAGPGGVTATVLLAE